jgi:hypothetical protein
MFYDEVTLRRTLTDQHQRSVLGTPFAFADKGQMIQSPQRTLSDQLSRVNVVQHEQISKNVRLDATCHI